MINIIDKNRIIAMHIKGQSIKSIVRETLISRNTVRSYIREYLDSIQLINQETNQTQIALMQEELCSKPKRIVTNTHRSRFTKEVEQRFLELIRIDEERNRKLGKNKQQVTAALLHRTLLLEGYRIGKSTISDEFKKYKDHQKECFIRQEYDFGERVEFDFHEAKLLIANTKQTIYIASFSFPKSNYVYSKIYSNQKLETLLDSIVSLIDHSKGVSRTFVFDNMRLVVRKFIGWHQKELTDDIIKISNYYGFEVILTNTYSGNEKGHVENSGKILRRDFFSLRYEFDSLEEANQYFETSLEERNKPYLEAFLEEKKHMLHAPFHSYQLGRIQEVKVNYKC